MGSYLNPGNLSFRGSLRSKIYVDKSELIARTNEALCTEQKYICVSRPRRFGKSMAANMLAAYYDRSENTEELFQSLAISKDRSYKENLNQYDVIKINMQEFLSMSGTMEEMLEMLKKYLDFLRAWLKDKDYVALAYMTGILPIKKYGSHSALNMFTEYSMTNPREMSQYFGFTETEVKKLCERFQRNFEETRAWYDQAYIKLNFDGLKDAVIRMLAGERIQINIGTFSNDMTNFQGKDDV